MKWLRISNWEKFQNYKNRTPPWIRIYNAILDKYEFGKLSDAGKGHLFSIWLLASRHQNKIPWDPRWIATRIQANTKVNLEELKSLGFIDMYQDASDTLADCKQNACLEERREEESREETEQRRLSHVGKPTVTKTPEQELLNFVQSLKTNPAYKGIDIDVELAKMDLWLQTPKGKRRRKTKGFILSWLNRIDRPIGPPKEDGLAAFKRKADEEAREQARIHPGDGNPN